MTTLTPTQSVYITGEVVVAVISIVGNLLVLAAIVKTKRLHTVTNVFIASLAIADVVVGFLAVPSATLSFLGLPRDFYGCVFINSIILMFTNVSILMLMFVALERFLAIKEPFLYQRILTTKRSIYLNIIVWLLGCALGLIPMYGWNKGYHPVDVCRFTDVITYEYMVYFQFFGLVLVPLFIMFCIYVYILIIVRRHMRKTNALQNLFQGNNNQRSREGFNKDVRAAKMFALVILLFGLFWLPVNIFNSLSLFCGMDCPFPYEALLAAIVMSHANSCINPFLYAASNSRIKQGIKSLFGARFAQDDSHSTEHNHVRNNNEAISRKQSVHPHPNGDGTKGPDKLFTITKDNTGTTIGKSDTAMLGTNTNGDELALQVRVPDIATLEPTDKSNGTSESQHLSSAGNQNNDSALSTTGPQSLATMSTDISHNSLSNRNYPLKTSDLGPPSIRLDSDLTSHTADSAHQDSSGGAHAHQHQQQPGGHSNLAFEHDDTSQAGGGEKSQSGDDRNQSSWCWPTADSNGVLAGNALRKAASEPCVATNGQSFKGNNSLRPDHDSVLFSKKSGGSISSNTTLSSIVDQKTNSNVDLTLVELVEDVEPSSNQAPEDSQSTRSQNSDSQDNSHPPSQRNVLRVEVDEYGIRRNERTEHTKL